MPAPIVQRDTNLICPCPFTDGWVGACSRPDIPSTSVCGPVPFLFVTSQPRSIGRIITRRVLFPENEEVGAEGSEKIELQPVLEFLGGLLCCHTFHTPPTSFSSPGPCLSVLASLANRPLLSSSLDLIPQAQDDSRADGSGQRVLYQLVVTRGKAQFLLVWGAL